MIPRPLAVLSALALGACSGPTRAKGELVPLPGLSAAEVNAQARPRRVALVVGVDQFSDRFWPRLSWAAKDAHDLSSALLAKEVGGFDEVRVLDDEAHTDRRSILQEIDRLAERAPREEDLVVLYVSAHGTLAQDPVRGLVRVIVVRDTKPSDLIGTGIPVDALIERFDRLPSRRRTLILATCHSGSGKSLLPPEVVAELRGAKGPTPLELVSSASLVLSAADVGQAAREDDRLENDVYTHYFVEALRTKADANGDGAVSATEAHDYARARTYAFTEGRQVPTVQATIAGADPMILAGSVAAIGRPMISGYGFGMSGLELFVDGQKKGVFPGSFAVEPGERALTVARPSGEVLVAEDVALAPGESLVADALLDRAQHHHTLAIELGSIGFLAPGVSEGVARPLFLAGVSFVARDVPWSGFDLGANVGLGTAGQTVPIGGSEIAQQLTAVELGVHASLARALGPLRLSVGPHLAYLILIRAIGPAALKEVQSAGALLPGVTLGASLSLGRLELSLRAQGHYLPLILDGQLRNLAALSLAIGTGVRF